MGEKIKLNITTSKTILDKNSANKKVIIDINENEQIQYVILAIGNFNKDIAFNIKGKDAQLEVIGICLLKNNEKINLNTIQFHKEKKSNSTNLIKTILKDSSIFNFEG
ncbi:MAG: SufD family Fe-S cluster assembly protein, partial [bacterium]|nr:SufD family Fe-S cluster assembly protein [bacterium]